jgi:hypothetical protein
MSCMGVYHVSAWGQPVGQGATQAVHSQVSAICKKNGPQTPYWVTNELTAVELGRILRLPIPPGFVILDANQTAYFASLNFNLTGVALPPVIPANFIASFQNEIGAILVFDIFIANLDRHTGNFSADYNGNPPSYNLFDHSHCLLGSGAPGTGLTCLAAAANSIVIAPNHALISGIQNETLLVQAIERVESIPDYFIPSVVREAAQYGLTADEENGLTQFLQHRRHQLRHLISSNKAAFPGVVNWSVL